jgi:hypothetical protein
MFCPANGLTAKADPDPICVLLCSYRKLTADGEWPSTAPFDEVLGPLNGLFPVLSLRTNKAEVMCVDARTLSSARRSADPILCVLS